MIRLLRTDVNHAPTLFPVLSDPALYRFTGDAPPLSVADLEGRLAAEAAQDAMRSWTIWCDPLGAPVGRIVCWSSGDAVEISIVIGAGYGRKGFAFDALEVAFTKLAAIGINRVTATIDVNNLAAQALVQKAGFVRISSTEIASITNGQMGEYFYERNLP